MMPDRCPTMDKLRRYFRAPKRYEVVRLHVVDCRKCQLKLIAATGEDGGLLGKSCPGYRRSSAAQKAGIKRLFKER